MAKTVYDLLDSELKNMIMVQYCKTMKVSFQELIETVVKAVAGDRLSERGMYILQTFLRFVAENINRSNLELLRDMIDEVLRGEQHG